MRRAMYFGQALFFVLTKALVLVLVRIALVLVLVLTRIGLDTRSKHIIRDVGYIHTVPMYI